MSIVRHAILCFACLALCASCQRTSQDAWEDTRTCSRHMSRGLKALGGKSGNSRAVCSRDDFIGQSYCVGEDFVALPGQTFDDQIAMGDYGSRQPFETPGDPGSSVPGIEAFQDPRSNPRLSSVFRNVTFDYNSNQVKGQNNLDTIHKVADYMRDNRGVYIFVEGHCDERGPAAYNLSLGSRRANAVRNMLIEEGVNPDNIFTISYGKERPLDLTSNEEAWNKNRRAEFKVYQR